MLLDTGRLIDDLTRRQVRRVAIDGPGGSGKSTLARLLGDGWPGASIVEMDDFETYQATVDSPAADGHPDVERVAAQVLEPHAAGRAGRRQRYDWDEDRLAEWHDVPAGGVLLLEGVYSSCERLRRYLDFTIWVEAPYEVRLARGVERDGEEMRPAWVEEWMPAEQRYIKAEQPQERADLVLEGNAGGQFTVLRAG